MLVRHAAVVVDQSRPPHEWSLSDEGRAAARALVLPAGSALTSPEAKARETATLARLDAVIDERLREVERPWSDDYQQLVERYLGGEDLVDWEPRAAALARLRAALVGFETGRVENWALCSASGEERTSTADGANASAWL